MSGRWKRLVAILGVTALVVGQSEALVKADELPDDVKETIIAVEDEEVGDSMQEASIEHKSTESSEETKSGEEASTEHKSTESSEETKSGEEASAEKESTESSEETKSSEESSTEQESTESSEETKSSEESSTEQESTESLEETKSGEESSTEQKQTESLEEKQTVETTVEIPTEAITVAEEYGVMLLAEDENTNGLEDNVINGYVVPEVSWEDFARYKIINNNSKEGYYTGRLWRDGEFIGAVNLVNYRDQKEFSQLWDSYIEGSGEYYCDLLITEDSPFGGGTEYLTQEGCIGRSEIFSYEEPVQRVQTPQNVRWSAEKTGTVEWDSVPGVYTYNVQLLQNGYIYVTAHGYPNTECDLSAYLNDDNAEYSVKVKAVSSNCLEEANGNWSETVMFDLNGNNEDSGNKVDDIFKDLNEESTKDEVETAVSSLQEICKEDISAIQISMQTDSDMRGKIAQLESLYMEKSNVKVLEAKVSEDIELDSSKISILGAALNALPDKEIALSIRKPELENIIDSLPATGYKNVIQFSMDLENIDNTKALKVPVSITLPVPEGINPYKLVIFHEESDGTLTKLDHAKYDAENEVVTFTITHFSEFLFAEEIPEVEEKPSEDSGSGSDNSSSSNDSGNGSDNSSSSNDSDSSSSSNASSATSVRPKEKAPTIGKSEGWNAIAKEVDKAIVNAAVGEEAVVWVKLNDAKEIPESALNAIAGKNVVVCFVTNTGAIINVSGASLDVNAIGKVSFSSTTDEEGNVILKIRNSVTDINKSIAIFAKATVNLTTEETLYFVDADSTLIPFGTSGVAENGYVAFSVPFVNANYVIK